MQNREIPAASGRTLPTIFLHIGLPKTATTTIQSFLESNRNELRQAGVLYPRTGITVVAHHQFGAVYEGRKRDWVEDRPLPELLAELRAEVANSGCSKVILSSEIFTYVRNAELLHQTLMNEYKVRVLVSLRRQDRWLESCLRQDLQVGDYSGSVERYVLLRRHQCDYYALVEFWASLVGWHNVVPRLLSNVGERISVQQHFLEDCGIPWSDSYSMNKDANPRLSRECIEFLQLAPDDRRVAGLYPSVRDILRDYSAEQPDPPKYRSFFSPALCRQLLADFGEGNAKIAERYFPQLSGQLFDISDLDEDGVWEEYPGLDLQTAGRIAFYLVDRLGLVIDAGKERGMAKEA